MAKRKKGKPKGKKSTAKKSTSKQKGRKTPAVYKQTIKRKMLPAKNIKINNPYPQRDINIHLKN